MTRRSFALLLLVAMLLAAGLPRASNAQNDHGAERAHQMKALGASLAAHEQGRTLATAELATDANLITAIDVSGSIEPTEERLQVEGMALALVDPMFLRAIQRGLHGRIGFVAFTWANGEFVTLVPWSQIGSRAEAEEIARRLRAARGITGLSSPDPANGQPWQLGHATDVSGAIEHAIRVSAAAPFASDHNVINICANGIDNIWEGPDAARDHAFARGLTINGLVLGHRDDAGEIARYFREHVQAGPGSFVIEARQFADMTDAMLAKFLADLAAVSASQPPHPPAPDSPESG